MCYPTQSVEQIGFYLLLFVFLGGGMLNLLNWNLAKRYLEIKGFSKNAQFVLTFAVIWQFMGVILSIVPGFTIYGYLLLILFIGVSSFYLCQFWKIEGLGKYTTAIQFLANIGVIGGLVILAAQVQEYDFFPIENFK
ncbi:MAG: hypothetical protein K2P93_08615 [Alphaproteobacteria bacterium]|nr:hypothetical protein [Alphaproteobacteria bacterium]